MHSDDTLRVDGTILETLSPALHRLGLRNGHQLVGHLSKALKAAAPALAPGDVVQVEMSPCDLSRGRVVAVVRQAAASTGATPLGAGTAPAGTPGVTPG